MLDFRPTPGRTTNYLARGRQLKLLGVVLVIGLVLLFVSEAGRPNAWNWLKPGGYGQAAAHAKAVEMRLPARAAGEEELASAEAKPTDAAVRMPLFAGIDASWLDEIQDDSLLRDAEFPAFYGLLSIAQKTDNRLLHQSSSGPVSFVQLDQQPAAYRGDLVDVRGRVRGVFVRAAQMKEAGIQNYYEVWIQAEDRAAPIVVDCLDLPHKFPLGAHLNEPIEATGFFFKRWAYFDEDRQLRTAPLLVAKTIDWTPSVAQAPAVPPQVGGGSGFSIFGLCLLGLLAFLAMRFALGRSQRRPAVFSIGRGAAPESASGLAVLDELRDLEVAPDVRQALEDIARRERGEDNSPAV